MKIAVISGASGNLGRAVVSQFLNSGYRVIGLVHKSNSKNIKTDFHQEIVVDLLASKAVINKLSEILNQWNKIDVVICTAGGYTPGNIQNTSSKDLLQQYHLNFLTAYHLAQPIFLQMQKQQFGKLFFIGSQPGKDTSKGKNSLAYSLSKSQLFQLANIINAESKDTQIKAFVVIPSTIDTSQNREAMPNADYSKWEKTQDIASMILRYTEIPSQKTLLEL